MYRYDLTRTDLWWERWFDFEFFYKAFSYGESLGNTDSITMDASIAQTIFEMYGNMGNSLLVGEIPQIWQQDVVPVVMCICLPSAPSRSSPLNY